MLIAASDCVLRFEAFSLFSLTARNPPCVSSSHLTYRPQLCDTGPPCAGSWPGIFPIPPLSLLFIRLSMALLWIPSLSLRVSFCTPLSEIILMAACTAGDWFQLQCITMGFHKKSLLQRDKNLIEFLKAEGWAFWIFPACAAWRQQIKDGICGDYSQMACNEWLSFPLMVSKRQSKKHDVSNIWEWLQVALLRPAVCCSELRRSA